MLCRTLPESRSRHNAERVVPSGGAVVSQTCLPRTTGDDQPLPGMAVFQAMLVFSSQVVGKPVDWETPAPLGPRNCVQESSAPTGRARHIAVNIITMRMIDLVQNRFASS